MADDMAVSVAAAQDVAWVHALIERQFHIEHGSLWVEECPITELAEQYGTPFYVYSQQRLAAAWSELRRAFPARCDIYYSMKANPHPEIVRYFHRCGAGVEVASAGELQAAMAAGVPAGQILFAGPGKTDAELSLAVEREIGEIHCESAGELERVHRIAARSGRRLPVGLRINPALASAAGALQMGGRATQFGVDEEQLEQVLDQWSAWPNVQLASLHLNTGTQLLDVETILTYYRHALELARRTAERLGRPLHSLDFGGGLGIPYFAGQQPLDLDRLAAGLTELEREAAHDRWLASTRWQLEPGRFLAGPAGIYVTRVTDIKRSRGQAFAVLDGGMHHHLAASGNFGQVLRRAFPLAALNRLDTPATHPVTLVGPLCTPLDTLGKGVGMPPLAPGDLIGIFQAGAYARTSSPLHFLGHPTPPEVWVHGATHRLIRRRGDWSDPYRDVVPTPTLGASAQR